MTQKAVCVGSDIIYEQDGNVKMLTLSDGPLRFPQQGHKKDEFSSSLFATSILLPDLAMYHSYSSFITIGAHFLDRCTVNKTFSVPGSPLMTSIL